MGDATPEHAEFDDVAEDYDEQLAQGISVSGESQDYFIRGRVRWLRDRLTQLGENPQSIMDFGCGTGKATPYLIDLLDAKSLVGVEPSSKSLGIARSEHAHDKAEYVESNQYQPNGSLDLVYTSGVFHHIPPPQRIDRLKFIHDSLRSGGLFSLWENNPWNPGTRWIMSRIPFDRDAVTLSAPESRRLLEANGFEVLRVDFLFYFPKPLAWFRAIEPALSKLPLGAQYLVLCRKA